MNHYDISLKIFVIHHVILTRYHHYTVHIMPALHPAPTAAHLSFMILFKKHNLYQLNYDDMLHSLLLQTSSREYQLLSTDSGI